MKIRIGTMIVAMKWNRPGPKIGSFLLGMSALYSVGSKSICFKGRSHAA